jgi:hypothetical protein
MAVALGLGDALVGRSHECDHPPEVARLPSATIDGSRLRVRNVRNFDYRDETDFTERWETRTYDLSKLRGLDLYVIYWGSPSIAHTIMSWDFDDGQHLAVSIETRKEQGEGYSTLKGFFRQYELFYVVADERDVIGLRTNYRKDPPEQVYVYRLKGDKAAARRVFMDYVESINALAEKPRFYNSLTTNCTTNIWKNTHVNATRLAFSWKILVSGYVPELLYERGRLVTDGMSFSELTQKVHVNARAQAADSAKDFSRRIRE